MLTVIFRSMVVTSLRDKISVNYALLFPIALMIGLGLYFNQGEMPARIVTGVTAISTIFWGMQGIAFQVHSQRNKGVYKMLKLTPMQTLSFISIMIFARTVIGVALNMIVWFVGVLFFKIDLSLSTVWLTFLLVLIGTLCFTSFGFLIANFAKNEAQISILSNFIQMPMVLMSEAFYSLTNAPGWIQVVGKLLPFEYFVSGLRRVITGEGTLFLGLFIPLVYMIGALLLSVPTFRWEEQQVSMTNKARKFSH